MKKNRKRFQTPIQVTIFDQAQIIFERVFEEYPVVIGRNPRAEISFQQYDFISKQHAAIVENEGELLIVDLQSSNGIYFQGKKTKQAPVTEDGVVTIGHLTLRFRLVKAELAQAITLVAPAMAPIPTFTPKAEVPFPSLVKQDSDPTIVTAKSFPKASTQKPKPIETKLPEKLPATAEVKGKPLPTLASKPLPRPVSYEHHTHSGHHGAIVDGFELITPFPHAKNIKPEQRVLEGFITWKNMVYDVQQFIPGEKVSVGRGHGVGLHLPTLTRRADLAFYDGQKAQCYVPANSNLRVRTAERELTFEDLLKSQAVTKWNSGYLLKLGHEELASFDFGPDIEVHFRYAPAPRKLSKVKMVEPDEEIKKTALISGLIHGLIMAIALLNAPANKGPKIPNVPDRYARLLVEPPRKIIEEKKPEPEKPKPQEKPKEKVVKRVVQERPKKVVVRQPIKVNKTPPPVMKVTKAPPVPNPSPKPTPVNINSLGALSALTAVSTKTAPSTAPVAININKNAGGPSKFTTTGVLGTLKTSSGKLQAGGIASVQTKGLGVGSGTGYGIQGLKGTAGSRGVAGGIVGSPQIMSVSADEGLTRAQVMAVVKKYLGEIQQCYERSLFQQPGLAGKIEYEWEITSRGSVTWTKVKSSQMSGADAMNSCVFVVFKKMQFPTAKNGQSTIPSIPLEFGKL